jgi:hypothetical protein
MLAAALTLVLAAAPASVPAVQWTKVESDLGFAAFSGSYPFLETIIELPKGSIRLLVSNGKCGVSREQLRAWVERAGQQVAQYYGKFPIERATVSVITGDEGEIGGGMAFAGRVVHIEVGTAATQESLDDDWRMPHELLHLAFPDVDDNLRYLEEGLSTYLEPIIRAQHGDLRVENVWGDMVLGFPNGMPSREDKGLDHTNNWGNTYWGGARFWLMVDLEIRIQTKGQKSLQDVLRAILAAGGDQTEHWPLEKILVAAKEATGTDALRELHAKMGMKRAPFDLDGLWKKLGVRMEGKTKVIFDDTAPLAAYRKAITEKR